MCQLLGDGIDVGGPKSPGRDSTQSAVEAPYFLLVAVRVLKQVSEYGPSASAIVRLGALQPCVTVLHVFSDFADAVIMDILEMFWNVLEHSAAVLSECACS